MSTLRAERRNRAAALDTNPRHRRVLFMHSYLAGFTALQILYLALDDLKFNLVLSLGYTCGFIFSYCLPPRFRGAAEYSVSALAAVASFYCAQLWRQDMSLYGNLLGSLGGVLMVLLSFRTFTTNAQRFILMFCVVFLMFGAVASYDLKFMLLLPLFLVFSGCALYVANQIDVHARAQSGDEDEMPSGSGLTRQFIGVLLRAIGAVLLLSVLAYIMAPHSATAPGGLLLNKAGTIDEPGVTEQQPGEGETGGSEAETGIGEDFDLSDGGGLSDNPQPVLKVKTHRAGYMRAKVYDQFTGAGWEQSELLLPVGNKPGRLIDLQPQPDPYAAGPSGVGYRAPLVDFPSETVFRELERSLNIRLADRNLFSQNKTSNLSYDVVQQQVTLLADQPPYYFAVYQPFRLHNLSRTSSGRLLNLPYLDRASTLRPLELERTAPKGFGYTVYSLEPKVAIRQLDEVYSPGPPEITEHYIWLPLATADWREEAAARGINPESIRPVSQRLVNFARTKFGVPDIVDGREVYPSVWDKAKRINDWLAGSGEFEYIRDHPPLPDGKEVTEAFVFDTQSGWCRYFASAMAVLCRINGVPARIVSGYAPGSYSLADNAFIYRASNAHAWVEVYFDGYGWIMFDPTPESRSPYSDTSSTNAFVSVVDFLQDLFVIDPAGTQKTILEGFALLWAFMRENLATASVSAALMLMLVAAVLLLRRRRHGVALPAVRPENEVVAVWLHLQDQLRRLGFVLETGDTPRQIMAAAVRQFPQFSTPLQSIVPLYERAAFGGGGLHAETLDEVSAAAAEIDQLVAYELEQRRQARKRR